MKYDITKKPTIGATRTLNSLQQAMYLLLAKKCFEEISVQELCEKAVLPRATFYNYFEDKFDLLNYCFLTLRQQTEIWGQETCGGKERLATFLENGIDFLEHNWDICQKILKNNQPNQYFFNHFYFYLRKNMVEAFKNCPYSDQYKAPQDMVARLCSEAVLIVLEWKYMQKKDCSKAQAKEYLLMLIDGIMPQ